MFELTEKRALVTGASGAIGGAIARALHQQGASVGLSGTRRDALDSLAADLGDRVAGVGGCEAVEGKRATAGGAASNRGAEYVRGPEFEVPGDGGFRAAGRHEGHRSESQDRTAVASGAHRVPLPCSPPGPAL